MKYIKVWLLAMIIAFAPMVGLADEGAEEKAPVAVEATVEGSEEAAAKEATAEKAEEVLEAEEVETGSVVAQLMKVVADWKAFGLQAGLMALLTLLLSTVKNSALRKYLWDWAGAYKVFVAPGLALIIVLLGMDQWNLGGVFVALTTGFGAVAMHQVIEAIKSMPGAGPVLVAVADMVAKLLKKPPKKVNS